MNIKLRDTHLRRISALGKSGGMPLKGDPQVAIDTLQRRCGALEEAVAMLLSAQGPTYGSAGNLFRIDARTTSVGYNLLTAAQALVEVGVSAEGFAIFKHGLNLALDNIELLSWDLAAPLTFDEAAGTSAAATQPERAGGWRRYAFDNARTILQLDKEAVAQQAVGWFSLHSSKFTPTNGASPTLNGAASINNGLTLASGIGTTTVTGT